MEYSAYIYYNQIKICKILYFDDNMGSYMYIFEPIYDVLDSLKDTTFRGIQGIDLSLRKEKYIRKNLQPVFIFERNPIRGKKHFKELQRVENQTLLEFLANNDKQYFGDNLSIKAL